MVKIRKISKTQLKEEYDATADIYDRARSKTMMGEMIDKIQVQFIYENIPKREGINVLEAGCGTGRILIPLAKRGINSYGVDPSQNMLNILKNKKKDLKINIKRGDIEKIPYPDNTFDVVFTMHVLMHMVRYEKAIGEMYRVLKPGGKMIVDFPNKYSPYTILSIILNPNKVRTHLFSKKYLKKLFNRYNYKINGLFSYSKFVYHIPLIRHLFYSAEKFVKLPVDLRSQLFVIVKK